MKRSIICNTGPLIALSLIDALPLLTSLFNPTIPKPVYAEWLMAPDGLPRKLPEGFQIVDVPRIDPALSMILDAGEASVIQLALSQNVPLVIIDERKGRKIARRKYNLQTIGTARVLVEAKKAGLISQIAPLFEKLRQESYWIADPIVQWALESVGETKLH